MDHLSVQKAASPVLHTHIPAKDGIEGLCGNISRDKLKNTSVYQELRYHLRVQISQQVCLTAHTHHSVRIN